MNVYYEVKTVVELTEEQNERLKNLLSRLNRNKKIRTGTKEKHLNF